MEVNEDLRDTIFDIINNQIRDNDPPETKVTYDRLRDEGYTEFVTKQLIGQCVAVELFRVMKHGETFNLERYVSNLKALPEEPFEMDD